MIRSLICGAACLLVVSSTVAAAPPEVTAQPPAPLHPVAGAKPAQPLSGRKQLEALLQSPAQLDFGPRKMVTVQEVLDQLHQRHRLSIRFDRPTLAGIYRIVATSGTATECRPAAVAHESFGTGVGAALNGLFGVQALGAQDELIAVSPAYAKSPTTVPTPPHSGTASEAVGPIPTAASEPQVANPAARPSLPIVAAKPDLEPARPDAPTKAVTPAPPTASTGQDLLDHALSAPLDASTVDWSSVSVGTALRIALDAATSPDADDEPSGAPILLTNATLLDYVVENDGLLITTRMKALTYKETRVYSIKQLKDVTSEQLAVVIRQSIRPWSWRSRIDELGERLKSSDSGVSPQLLGSLVKSGVQLASAETGITVSPTPTADEKSEAKPAAPASGDNDVKEMQMLGNSVVNGLVTFAHATLTTLEIVHYADPPTGSIQTLPGRLVITQSQAAHREIAELLKQLEEE